MSVEPFQWTARIGRAASLMALRWSVPGIVANGREVTGTAAQLGELAALLDGNGEVGTRAAAAIRRDVYEAVVIVGLLNPALGFRAVSDLRAVLGPTAGVVPTAPGGARILLDLGKGEPIGRDHDEAASGLYTTARSAASDEEQ